MSNLAERVDSFPQAWKPQPGDKLVGEVVELDERENEYGSYPIVTVRADDGVDFAFHAFRTVAKNELAKQRPQVGERIGIKYLGKPEGNDYEVYRVKVERGEQQQQTLDWAKHSGTADSENQPSDAGTSASEEDDPSRSEQRPAFRYDDDIAF